MEKEKLKNLKKRFANQVELQFSCRIVTPMFLGDAWQGAALRAEPFKGLLRYWWRIAAGSKKYVSPQELLEAETGLFGSGGDKAQKSLVTITTKVEYSFGLVVKNNLPSISNIIHPEVDFCPKECLKEHPECRRHKKLSCEVRHEISPLCYLSGMGLTFPDGQKVKKSYLPTKSHFYLKLTFPQQFLEDEAFKTALFYFCAFGTIGSRSRNGWGSFQVEKIEPEEYSKKLWNKNFIEDLENSFPHWKKCFNKHYPHTLAKGDNGKPLLWKKEGFESWQEAMKFLAEVYIYVRTGYAPRNYSWPKEKPLDSDDIYNIAERHLLGFPLTNHPAQNAGWGYRKPNGKFRYEARLASPLRFVVRKHFATYQIFILHLPYYLDPKFYLKTNKKVSWPSKEQQIKLWQKVHERLDQAMQRASINECL